MNAFILEAITPNGQVTILASHFERGPIALLRRSIGRTMGRVRIQRHPIADFPEVLELREIANGEPVTPIIYQVVKAGATC